MLWATVTYAPLLASLLQHLEPLVVSFPLLLFARILDKHESIQSANQAMHDEEHTYNLHRHRIWNPRSIAQQHRKSAQNNNKEKETSSGQKSMHTSIPCRQSQSQEFKKVSKQQTKQQKQKQRNNTQLSKTDNQSPLRCCPNVIAFLIYSPLIELPSPSSLSSSFSSP